MHLQKRFLKFPLFLVFIGLTHSLHASTPAVDDVQFHRSKREIYNINDPYNANLTSRFIELEFVVDNALYKRLESNSTKVTQRLKNIVNTINSVFQKVNIFVALVSVVIWNDRDKIEINRNIETTFINFDIYAKSMINEHVDHVILMTGIVFDNNYTIRFSPNMMCTSTALSVCKDNLSKEEVITSYLVLALAQSIGIPYDTDECICSAGKCVMSRKPPRSLEWSACSINSMESILANKDHKLCLNNKPLKIYDGPVCGNSFTEPGEECDCGLPEQCDIPCCNATTCKFSTNATCAIGACCDLNGCKVHNSGVVCRVASQECDLTEYCDGESELCPEDVFKNTREWCAEGSKCDTSKHKCKETVYTYTHVCLENCNGNGICDSKGRCHCKDGFLPPTCRYINTIRNSTNLDRHSQTSNLSSDSNSMEWKHYYLFLMTTIIVIVVTLLLLLYVYYNIIPKWSLARDMYRSQAKYHVSYDNVFATCSTSSSMSTFLPRTIPNIPAENFGAQTPFEKKRFSNNTYASINENSIYGHSKNGSNSSTKNQFLNEKNNFFCENQSETNILV